MRVVVFVSVLLIVFQQVSNIVASAGDGSLYYQKCVRKCTVANCTNDGEFTAAAAARQEVSNWILFWGCRDECRYDCMWPTVNAFLENGMDYPKFHGKWPFRRFLGVQEPASAFSSLLNLASHVFMHLKLAHQFPADTTLVRFWHGFALVCENAWIWSTVFHTRDTQFTEFMDYACALSMVMALLVAAIVRIWIPQRRRKRVVVVLACLLGYYVTHVRYLYSGRVDYGFNMTVNILIGGVGGLLWTGWALVQVMRGRQHVACLLYFTALSTLLLALELTDFPPRLHAWDAHALWHLATAPLPLLFYRFVLEDLQFLQNLDKLDEKADIKLS